jgi:hypothetical protein
MKGMNLYSVVRKSTVCYLWMEGEPVIGTFFADSSGAFTGVHFRSSICPNFIKHDNDAANETEESGMTGFCAEVTDVKMRWNEDNSRKLFVSFDEGKTFHLVRVLTVDGTVISDTGSILP